MHERLDVLVCVTIPLLAMAPKHPYALSSLGYRKAVVRYSTEVLRELEGRLPQPSGPRWETQLQACEDLAGVARLVLALQRRSEALKGTVDNTWLEELSQMKVEEIDERAVEFTRRLKHRLDELQAAISYPLEPETLLGAAVVRGSDGQHGACRGTVIEHDESTGFRVLYTDGDVEDLPLRDVQSLLVRGHTTGTRSGIAAASAPNGESATESAGANGQSVSSVAGGPTGGPVGLHGGGHLVGAVAGSMSIFATSGLLSARNADGGEELTLQAIYDRVSEQRHWSTSGGVGHGVPIAHKSASTASRDAGGRGSKKAASTTGELPLDLSRTWPARARSPAGTQGVDTAAQWRQARHRLRDSRPTPAPPIAGVKRDAQPPSSTATSAAGLPGGCAGSSAAVCAGDAVSAAEPGPPEGLPEGWAYDLVAGRPRFTSPDGLTVVTSLSKAVAWHKQQLARAAQFVTTGSESAASNKEPTLAPPSPRPHLTSPSLSTHPHPPTDHTHPER